MKTQMGTYMSEKKRNQNGNFNPVIFIPGLAFVVLGLAVVFAPRLFLLVMATVLLCIGAGLCFLAWKFIQFRRKLQKLAKDFETQANQDPRFSTFDTRSGGQSGQNFQGVKVISSYTVSGTSGKSSVTTESEDDYEATKTLDKDGNITYH